MIKLGHTRDTAKHFAYERGWTRDALLDLVLDWAHSYADGDALLDHLQARANEEDQEAQVHCATCGAVLDGDAEEGDICDICPDESGEEADQAVDGTAE